MAVTRCIPCTGSCENVALNHETEDPAKNSIGTDLNFNRKIVWYPNVLFFAVLHLAGLYGYYLGLFKCHIATFLYSWFLANVGGFGVTGGAHRLYAHRSYKANLPLRIFILAVFTMAGQNSMYRWVLDHRQHHKYTDTDADPHNSNRGFFFSHIGWLMSRPHPAVIEKRRSIDMTDMENDPLVMFQRKHFFPIYIIMAFLIPMGVPLYFFDETLWNAFFVSFCWRYVVNLNFSWTVNSIAHLWGTRPFDKFINPRESYLVAYLAIGEGWHNYHHSFPWDYKASEHGITFILNPTTYIIDFFARFGWTYDLRTTSDDMIRKKVSRTGDGTHPKSKKFVDVNNNIVKIKNNKCSSVR